MDLTTLGEHVASWPDGWRRIEAERTPDKLAAGFLFLP